MCMIYEDQYDTPCYDLIPYIQPFHSEKEGTTLQLFEEIFGVRVDNSDEFFKRLSTFFEFAHEDGIISPNENGNLWTCYICGSRKVTSYLEVFRGIRKADMLHYCSEHEQEVKEFEASLG